MKYLTVFKLLQFRPGELLITAYYSVDQRYSKLDYKFMIKIRKNNPDLDCMTAEH